MINPDTIIWHHLSKLNLNTTRWFTLESVMCTLLTEVLTFHTMCFRCATSASAAPATWRRIYDYTLGKSLTSASCAIPSSRSTSTSSCTAVSTAATTVPTAASSAPRPFSTISLSASTSAAPAQLTPACLPMCTWKRWWSGLMPAKRQTRSQKQHQRLRLGKPSSTGWLVP